MDFAKTRQILDLKLLCFLVLISLVFVFNFHDAVAVPTTIINNYQATSNTGWNGNIWLEKFSGLVSGNKISAIGYQSSVASGNVRVKVYDDSGLKNFTITNTFTGNIANGWNGKVYVEKFTNPTSNSITINGVGVSFTSGSGSCITKIYTNNAGTPNSLLADSNSQTCLGMMTVPHVTIGAGQSFFAGFETSSSTISANFQNPNTSTMYAVAHSYGAGPNPFGAGSLQSFSLTMSIQYTNGTTGMPNLLLGESSSVPMGTGINNVNLNAIIPASGNVWAGFELDSNTANMKFSNGLSSGTSLSVPHTYSAGPSTFGPIISNQTTALWSSLTFDNARLILSPTSGNVGSTVTASGTGFTPNPPTTSVHNFQSTNSPQNQQNLELQEFTGLPAGKTITSFGLKINSLNNGFQNQNSNAGAIGCNFDVNKVMLAKFQNLPAGDSIQNVNLKVFTPAGNVRIKLYDDANGGNPQNLLAETGSTPLTASGGAIQKIPITATIPADGVVYGGFEMDSSSACVGGFNPTGLIQFVETAHTYGAGPNPIGSVGANNDHWYFALNYTVTTHIRAKIYSANGTNGCINSSQDCPSKLLGETNSIAPSSTGIQNFTFPVPVVIPSNGTVWAGFESTNIILDLFYAASTPNTQYGYNHVFGTGPTTLSGFGITGSTGFGFAEYMLLNYNNGATMKLKWDGSTLVTNPSVFQADSSGAFSNVNFTVPSSVGGFHTVNASDASDWSTAQFSTNAQYSVSLRPTLHDGVTPITSGKLIVTQNGVTIGTGNTNSSGYATVSNLSGGNYNFTIIDDKNFAVYKELNTNVASNIAKNVATNDTPFNCVSPFIGYQSDFIIRINDTDGTHITSITTPTCPNQKQLLFNVTFTGNGQSGNTFSSSMITTAGTQVYAANPSSFTVSGTLVPTTFTGGNNIVSNSFSVGSGLATVTKNFIMNLTATQSTNAGAGSSGQNYFTTNSTCFAGVFDPKTNTCVFGLVNITAPPVIITTNPNTQQTGGVEVDCSGNGYITITSANLGSNPLGIALGQLPINIQCGQTTPTTCPTGTTLTNGVCIAPLTCPIGSQTQNGICTAPLTCPTGTTLQNAQCIAPTTCADGSQPVNGQCNNVVPIIIPPTPSPCDITNPLSCITSTTQSQDVVVTGVTPDGKPISVTTTVTKVLNPELNNVSLVIILLIIAAIIAGIIYRYLTRKKKPKGRKVKNYSGNGNKIDRFNKKVKNEV